MQELLFEMHKSSYKKMLYSINHLCPLVTNGVITASGLRIKRLRNSFNQILISLIFLQYRAYVFVTNCAVIVR